MNRLCQPRGAWWVCARRLLRLTLCAAALLPVHLRAQQATLSTIISNGPTANRFNVVVLSEGYTAGQLPTFRTNAADMVEALLAHQPFQEYRSYFNAFAISVASTQSGSDHPANPSYVNTYFNSGYDLSDRLLTIPANSTGQGKVDALVQSLVPAAHLAILVVNDRVTGASDGFGNTAIVSIGPSISYMSDYLAHEVGHVMAELGDEYETPSDYPDTEEINTTRETNRTSIKWNHWIADTTPVPTPPTFDYSEVVGLFEGAHYHSTGWYRPKLNCAMRDNVSPFCEVCAEALVLSLYAECRPVDSFVPANTNVLVSTSQPLIFAVELQGPATQSLLVQWHTNSTPVIGATNSSLSISPLLLREGTNTITAFVQDGTGRVRRDPMNLLSQTVSWNVDVAIPKLELSPVLWLIGGKFALRVHGTAPNGFILQSSRDLVAWGGVTTNSLVAGRFWHTNHSAGSDAGLFYRALARP